MTIVTVNLSIDTRKKMSIKKQDYIKFTLVLLVIVLKRKIRQVVRALAINALLNNSIIK